MCHIIVRCGFKAREGKTGLKRKKEVIEDVELKQERKRRWIERKLLLDVVRWHEDRKKKEGEDKLQ